jgi:hypothetical protein
MSSLWTPSGEHRVPRSTPGQDAEGAPGDAEREQPARTAREGAAPAPEEPGGEETTATLDDLQREVLAAPAEAVVANHCYGLFELAALHLSQQPPQLDKARLAIDALACLVQGLQGRLGPDEASLREGVTQIQVAFVRLQSASRTADGPEQQER